MNTCIMIFLLPTETVLAYDWPLDILEEPKCDSKFNDAINQY